MVPNQAPVRGSTDGVDDVGDVLQHDRGAVAVGDDHVAECARVEQLVVGVQRELLMRAFEIALRLRRALRWRARCGLARG